MHNPEAKQKIESLEFQVTQVYDALRHAATTGQNDDAFWAWAIYQALQVNLQSHVFPKLMNERREIPRQTPLDRQFLQYVVMLKLPDYLKMAAIQRQQGTQGTAPERSELPVPDNELQALIDNPSSPYMAIVARASQLVAAGKVEAIFMAVEHIREIYPNKA